MARAALPALQSRNLDHKFVLPLSAYISMNAGEQQGKFITIYPGPMMDTFTRLIGALDTLLLAMDARPGPQPSDRQSEHTRLEQRIARSGLLFYVVSTNYRS